VLFETVVLYDITVSKSTKRQIWISKSQIVKLKKSYMINFEKVLSAAIKKKQIAASWTFLT
jgi:hypothetical protein